MSNPDPSTGRRHIAMLAALESVAALIRANPDADPGVYLTLFLHERDDGSYRVALSLSGGGAELAYAAGCVPTGSTFNSSTNGRAYRTLEGQTAALDITGHELIELAGDDGVCA